MNTELLKNLGPFPGILALAYGMLLACTNENVAISETPGLTAKTEYSKEELVALYESYPYSVQVAAFSVKENAVGVVSLLKKSKIPAYIVSDDSYSEGLIYRIHVGHYVASKDAEETLNAIRALGFGKAFAKDNLEHNQADRADSTSTSALQLQPLNKRLTSASLCRNPQWSPNNREIAFFKDDGNAEGLYTIGTGGGPISRIIESDKKLRITARFFWSPLADKIALVAEEINSRWEKVENLYMIQKDGSGLLSLLRQEQIPFQISTILWSPDAQRIALKATYGQGGADSFSRILIIEINVRNGGVDEKGAESPREMSGWETGNRLVGWKSPDEFIFLTCRERKIGESSYDVWSYDIKNEQKEKLARSAAIVNCKSIRYLAAANQIIYSAYGDDLGYADKSAWRIQSFNLSSGESFVFYEKESQGDILQLIDVSASNEILFRVNHELWLNDITGKKATFSLPMYAHDFALSPTGTRLAMVKQGYLHTLKLNATPTK